MSVQTAVQRDSSSINTFQIKSALNYALIIQNLVFTLHTTSEKEFNGDKIMLVEPAKLDKDEDLATHISKTNLIVTFGVDLKALFNRLLKIDPNAACYKSIICLTEADFKQVLKLTADQAYLESDSMEKVNDLPGRFIEEFVEEYSEYLGVAKSVVYHF